MSFPQSSPPAAPVEIATRFASGCFRRSVMAALEASRHPAATNRSARHSMSIVRASSSGMRFASQTNPQMSSGASRQDCTIRPSQKQSLPVPPAPSGDLGKENQE